ncbi:MAG TPA: Glu-tRNA(Gln) amidotransferase subunit GatE [Candidatus Nanoarchaeia archaeon]|nr:Glu-tRNA(Gln) amidotransferase subunit GatE [Candidatus Nanoarchaeia archaeon]
MDYSKIGLKAGIEIHQQLETSEKLFSHAPSYLRNEKADYIVQRKLHKVAGEQGQVDAAVKHEAEQDREFHYEGYNDTVSLVELDEEPPYMVNQEALEECLKVALLLNCEIYQNTQIMRKTVIDGSNTSGFQRTVLIGHDGYVETSFGKVRIDTVVLEEDSARIISKDERKAVYRLDRLGIPLIEIATAPDMNTPEQIKETALKIGEILRACNVKRGLGTIRQDVNVSIKGHDRVEIKGFQDPKMMIETVNKEILRQQKDISEGKVKGEVRGALETGETEFLRPMPGKARMYPETDLPLLYVSLDLINKLKKNLPKLKQEIKVELKKKGLNDEMIKLVLEDGVDEFETLLNVYDKDANLVAKMITLWRQEFSSKTKKNLDEVKQILNEKILEKILENLATGKISDGDVKTIMLKVLEGKNVEDALKVEKSDDNTLEHGIREIVKEKPGLRANAYMGLVIAKFGASVDKRKAMEILNKVVGDGK